MNFEKVQDMRKTVEAELESIPRNYRGSRQNHLRCYYSALRLHGLKIGEPKDKTFAKSIKIAKNEDPTFWPSFKPGFFDEKQIKKFLADPGLLKEF